MTLQQDSMFQTFMALVEERMDCPSKFNNLVCARMYVGGYSVRDVVEFLDAWE